MDPTTTREPLPAWFWGAATLGLAWNVFGVVQFLATARGSVGSLMGNGMTQQQAELYLNLPLWMNVAFAIGVFGGVLGCILLLLRKTVAVAVFGASLAAYVVLYIGDITEGVFEAFGTPQVAILSTVVLIAVALLWLAIDFRKRGALR